MAAQFPNDELVACAEREVAMRDRAYPKWEGKTSIEECSEARQKERAMMQAIKEQLEALPILLERYAQAKAAAGKWIDRNVELPNEKLPRLIAWHKGIDDDTWPQAPQPMIMDAKQFIGNPHIYTHWRYFTFAAPPK